MAPNKRSKKKSKGDSSSSGNYDRHRFISANAAQTYQNFRKKNILKERGMELKSLDCPVLQEAGRRGWMEFVDTPCDAVVPIIREFYANLKEQPTVTETRVRGKTVSFSREAINRLYNMPDIDNDTYTTYNQERPNYTTIIARLCREGAQWVLPPYGEPVTLPKSDLEMDAKSWFAFIVTRVMPSTNVSDLTKDKGVLIYAILTGLTVDLGHIISASIMNAANRTSTLRLAHPSLITALCHQAGVVWSPNEELSRPKAPIVVARSLMDTPARRRELPIPDAAISSHAWVRRSDPSPETLQEKLTSIDQRLEDIHNENRQFMRFVFDLSAALAHRLPSSDPNAVPFPHALTFPTHHHHDDEETDEDR